MGIDIDIIEEVARCFDAKGLTRNAAFGSASCEAL